MSEAQLGDIMQKVICSGIKCRAVLGYEQGVASILILCPKCGAVTRVPGLRCGVWSQRQVVGKEEKKPQQQ